MSCDVFDAAKADAQSFQANIGAACAKEVVCGVKCLEFDPSGQTSRQRVVEILLNMKWGRDQLKKFYARLQEHEVKIGNSEPVAEMQPQA